MFVFLLFLSFALSITFLFDKRTRILSIISFGIFCVLSIGFYSFNPNHIFTTKESIKKHEHFQVEIKSCIDTYRNTKSLFNYPNEVIERGISNFCEKKAKEKSQFTDFEKSPIEIFRKLFTK